MPIDRWMDKEDVVTIYNGILLNYQKEWNWLNCNVWMNLEPVIQSEIS